MLPLRAIGSMRTKVTWTLFNSMCRVPSPQKVTVTLTEIKSNGRSTRPATSADPAVNHLRRQARTCVQANVHLEAPRGGEALHAALALERLDARVRFDVGCQRALHGESPEALRALEGLLVGVDADVAHQVAGLAELLGAVGTHVPSHTILLADRPWRKITMRRVQLGLETAFHQLMSF